MSEVDNREKVEAAGDLDGGRPPFELFAAWYKEAQEKESSDPEAMALATAAPDGLLSARMVLLKGFDERGFVFYTNLESRKGQDLTANPRAALLFYWKSLRRQVRIEGSVVEVSEEEADAYFDTRPRQARIGAWASPQSRPLSSRFELEKRVAKYAAKYALGRVPRPPFWSGFRVVPERMEFWRHGAFRLHDRLVYTRTDGGDWRTERLYP